jgi:hypothetical protein
VSERFRGRSGQGLYGDVIEELDWSVGQLLGALDRHDLAADTLFIFTSDNGPWLSFGDHAGSTGGLREGKGTAFEGGARVPAIMRWPGRIRPGTVSRRIASTIDLLPTIAAVTGAALPPRPIDGVSILPLLAGDDGRPPRSVFLYYYGGELRAVREGRWKRVFPHATTSYEGQPAGHDGHPGPAPTRPVPAALYDLETDVAETRDVAARHPSIVARLEAIAEEARARLGDALTGRVGSEVRPPGRARFDRPDVVAHAGVGARVTLATPPSPLYPGAGAAALTDGRVGTKDHADGRWLGFRGLPLDATVDLGAPRTVRGVSVDCLRNQQAWIFLPFRIELSVSVDGTHWEVVARREEPVVRSDAIVARSRSVPAPGRPVRYLRVVAHPVDPLPAWHAGAGQPGWVFVDEIIVAV